MPEAFGDTPGLILLHSDQGFAQGGRRSFLQVFIWQIPHETVYTFWDDFRNVYGRNADPGKKAKKHPSRSYRN